LILGDVLRLSYPRTISGSPHFGIRPEWHSDFVNHFCKKG
jgi:hypothetical protein